MPTDPLQPLAEMVSATVPDLERLITFLKNRLPNQQKYPVSSAIIAAYLPRLELWVEYIKKGAAGLHEEREKHPDLLEEMQELESWIMRKKTDVRPRMTAEHENIVGDFLVSTGRSYSQVKSMLKAIQQLMSGQGAPHKRLETLRMFDARIANGWSYRQLAAKMCECGATQHTEHCSERIRKRLKELEDVLARYEIDYRAKS